MLLNLKGQQIFFDVCGSEMRVEGPRYVKKPTLILLHGGPGFDHTGFRPLFEQLADLVQVIFYDHRGNGRSVPSDSSTWNLDQWGDDIYEFCKILGIRAPIVLGQSFGGMVAQSYAVRHPEHPGALVLSSTAAKMDLDFSFAFFEKKGGPQARAAAEAFWNEGTDEQIAAYFKTVIPLYNTTSHPDGANTKERATMRLEVCRHFSLGLNSPIRAMDFRKSLNVIKVPTLILAGQEDPMTPVHLSEEMKNSMGSNAELVVFPGCGHGPFRDQPEPYLRKLRAFIEGLNLQSRY